MTASRVHMAVGCLFGAGAIAIWAWATHADKLSAGIAAQMLLIHAVAIIALTSARAAGLLHGSMAVVLISVLSLGVLLFAGDIVSRAYSGQRLFPMASPIGGTLMIASWLGLAVTSFLTRRG